MGDKHQNLALRRWSDMHGISVVSMVDGKKIGTCDDFYFDPATQQIPVFVVKTGLLGHKVLPIAQIKAIGADAITTMGEDSLQPDKLASSPTLVAGHELHDYKIMSEGGAFLGNLGDIALDITYPQETHVVGYEIPGGFLDQIINQHHTFAANQVVRYGQDLMVITDAAAKELHK